MQTLKLCGWILLGLFSWWVAAQDLLPPQQLIKQTSDQIQAELKKINYKVDYAKAVEIVDRYIEPHVDVDRFAAMVLGKHWRTATSDQRERFKKEFKTMLIRTYATAYGEYAEWEVRFKPIRDWNPAATKITVQTEFVQAGKQPVPVSFRMIRKGDSWKVYDIVVEGVDLVKNYRTTFDQEIAQRGSLDALIDQLEKRNREAFKDGHKASSLAQPIAGA